MRISEKLKNGVSEYQPLPHGLTIKQSGVHGLGLFTEENLRPGIWLGITHIRCDNRGWIRTPLGGFINHSATPNCYINTNIDHRAGEQRELNVVSPIKEGEELTVYYSLDYSESSNDIFD